jgi:hypothetical protein
VQARGLVALSLLVACGLTAVPISHQRFPESSCGWCVVRPRRSSPRRTGATRVAAVPGPAPAADSILGRLRVRGRQLSSQCTPAAMPLGPTAVHCVLLGGNGQLNLLQFGLMQGSVPSAPVLSRLQPSPGSQGPPCIVLRKRQGRYHPIEPVHLKAQALQVLQSCDA